MMGLRRDIPRRVQGKGQLVMGLSEWIRAERAAGSGALVFFGLHSLPW
jgi:hypothetical protein